MSKSRSRRSKRRSRSREDSGHQKRKRRENSGRSRKRSSSSEDERRRSKNRSRPEKYERGLKYRGETKEHENLFRNRSGSRSEKVGKSKKSGKYENSENGGKRDRSEIGAKNDFGGKIEKSAKFDDDSREDSRERPRKVRRPEEKSKKDRSLEKSRRRSADKSDYWLDQKSREKYSEKYSEKNFEKSSERRKEELKTEKPHKDRRADEKKSKERSGEKYQEKNKEKSKDKSKEKSKEGQTKEQNDEKPQIDPEAELKKLHELEAAKKKKEIEEEQKIILEAMENERRKRRKRIEDWREKIKKEITIPAISEKPSKSWNLEDENDEDEVYEENISSINSVGNPSNNLVGNLSGTQVVGQVGAIGGTQIINNVQDKDLNNVSQRIKSMDVSSGGKNNQKDGDEGDDEIDPLDAYMMELRESIKDQPGNIKTILHQEEEEEKPAIIHTVVTSKQKTGRDVEILEQFGDAAEYSSEEEEAEDSAAAISKRNLKVIPAVDHNKVYYRAFRKHFYIEVPEIAKMTDQEVAAYRVELGNVIVKGKGCPKPIKKWVQIGANPVILEVLKKSNFVSPTAIQAQAIPAIMSGRDVISIAKTGSGKTLAFLLPMFRHVLDQPPMIEGDGPIAIILTPTRELAVQIYKDCRKFSKHLNLKAICLYGGSVVSEQIAELKRGAEIAICTPGRLIDMLSVNGGRITNCRRCTFLVLDEADRMFDLGFEPQVQKILEQIRPDRQICLFTATFSLSMEALARRVLHKPLEIVVGKRNKVCTDVKQHLLLLESENKFLKLLELLGIYSDAGRILIFVERQEAADDLLKDLMTKGYPCMSIHGGRDQYDRDSSLSDFKSGVTNILVATSVAARGIDVKNIALVINYDCPNHGEDYVHRCGRTGRAGSKGTAITFITSRDAKYLKDILTVVENTNCEISQSIINLYQNFSLSDKNRRIKSSGFSGRGFKFDDHEMLHAAEQKKMLKWTFGWQDSGDEAEEETKVLKKIEQSIEKSFGNRPKLGSGSIEDSVDKDKAQLAKSIADRLNQKLKATDQTDALNKLVTTIPKPKPESLLINKNIELAKEIAEKLNVKINPEHVKGSNKPESRKLTAGEVFFEEIDINDFPQLARQRISTKETLDAVAEMSDCCLTIRGSYCPGGKPLDFTDRRLHLLIEGTTEFKVQIAKAEVKRIIKEESVKSDYAFIQPSSRYRIV